MTLRADGVGCAVISSDSGQSAFLRTDQMVMSTRLDVSHLEFVEWRAKGVSQQILTSLRGGENGQGWLGNRGLSIPARFTMSWQGRFYECSGAPLSGSVEIRSLRGSIVTRAPVDKSAAAALSANKTACSAFAGRISSARI